MLTSKKWISMSLLLVLFFIVIGRADQVQAQEKYPTRPIQIIVPFGPGASTDLDARLVATYMSKKWRVPINVINKPGGNAIPGMLEAYKAAPDGYTLMADQSSTSGLVAVTVPNLPFRVMDRTFIAAMVHNPIVMFISFSSPFKGLGDFANFAKKSPENVTWSMVGTVSTIDFTLKQLFREIGVDISKTKPVSVTGGAEAVTLASGGNLMIGASTITTTLPPIKGNFIRGVLITSQDRFPLLPDVPTAVELGYPKVRGGACWFGISGPPNLPPHIVDKWNKDFEGVAKDPEFISKLRNIGGMPFYHSAHDTKEIVLKEIEEFKELL